MVGTRTDVASTASFTPRAVTGLSNRTAATRPYNSRMLDFRAEKLAALFSYLRKHVSGEVRFDETSRRLYSTDASIYQVMPAGAVIPRTEQDLVAAVQIALETRTPITARGGGTSLSGQSIGPGLIIDCSKYLNAVGDIDVVGCKVRVQPGVVLDHLNRQVAPLGLQFGPEVSTASRATLGGMIGNNSAGSRSIVYGQTVDHVRALKAVLADGAVKEFAELTSTEWECKAGRQTIEGASYRTLDRVIAENSDEIDRRF